MKKMFFLCAALLCSSVLCAQNDDPVALPKPDFKAKSKSMIQTLRDRHSVREYKDKALEMQQISTLCWAACGISRDENHITSPTAMNRQEISLYVFTDKVVYLYVPKKNALLPVAKGDHRKLFVKNGNEEMQRRSFDRGLKAKDDKDQKKGPEGNDSARKNDKGQEWVTDAPVVLLMVIDFEKLGNMDERTTKLGYIDAGIVSENINLYCESVGLATVPRVTMNIYELTRLLHLNKYQVTAINNPVGYAR